MAMRLYIGNISYQTTEESLKALLAEFGEVASVRIITDKFSGRSKGFAFADMVDAEAGKAAIEALNGKEVDGRKIVVNEARPEEKRERSFNNRGDNGGRRDYDQGNRSF